MTYELAKELKNAGFPQRLSQPSQHEGEIVVVMGK